MRVIKSLKDVDMFTLTEWIEELRAEHPDEEIYIDGDLYAVCGKRRDAA